MRSLKKFDEYIKQGIVKKQTPDFSRAKDLIEDSSNLYTSLIEIIIKVGIKDSNANIIIKESYDIIMGLIRAKMLSKGFSSLGSGAHEAEVSFLRELNFREVEIDFLNQLRYFRNGVMYYGKDFNQEYAEKVFQFLKRFRIFMSKLD